MPHRSENIIRWDMAETKDGGPFPAILESDIFINCIYLSLPIPPFISREMLNSAERKMSVVVDVSCDTTNPHNPLPFADKNSTFVVPTFRVDTRCGRVAWCTTDHHLPLVIRLRFVPKMPAPSFSWSPLDPECAMPCHLMSSGVFPFCVRSAGPALDVSTIDHLPTLLPRESSDRFCNDLMPTIRALGDVRPRRCLCVTAHASASASGSLSHYASQLESNPVWARAIKLFNDKTAEMNA